MNINNVYILKHFNKHYLIEHEIVLDLIGFFKHFILQQYR